MRTFAVVCGKRKLVIPDETLFPLNPIKAPCKTGRLSKASWGFNEGETIVQPGTPGVINSRHGDVTFG